MAQAAHAGRQATEHDNLHDLRAGEAQAMQHAKLVADARFPAEDHVAVQLLHGVGSTKAWIVRIGVRRQTAEHLGAPPVELGKIGGVVEHQAHRVLVVQWPAAFPAGGQVGVDLVLRGVLDIGQVEAMTVERLMSPGHCSSSPIVYGIVSDGLGDALRAAH